MDPRDFVDTEAALDDEEDDLSVNGEGESARPRKAMNGDIDDSSEEEDDDDDEEAARIRDGFIVDEDEEEEEEEAKERRRRKKKDRKRRRGEHAQEDEGLDEEDLDLIGEANPDLEPTQKSQKRFKRLKRGHRDEDGRGGALGLEDIFFDDDEGDEVQTDRLGRSRNDPRALPDEFEDFIEEDGLTDEEEQQEERDVARPKRAFHGGDGRAVGLDQEAVELMQQAFGDGEEYDWALELEDEQDDQAVQEQSLELKDVFEPSELAEKLLTDEDNQIRWTDEPERFQLWRKPYKHIVLTDEQLKQEAVWITRMMPKRPIPEQLREPFLNAVAKVLDFFIVDEVEVPFIFQHRKDYLIHAVKVPVTPDPSNPSAPTYVVNAEKLLNQNDLWQIFEYDLKYRAFVEKRTALRQTYDRLKEAFGITDNIFEDLLPAAETMEELQDLQDYLYFHHSAPLREVKTTNGDDAGHVRRRAGHRTLFERIRSSKVYNFVRAFGITADAFAQNTLKEGRRQYADDPNTLPDDLADSTDMLDPPEFSTGSQVLKAAKLMFAEEIYMSPKMRKVMRQAYYMTGIVECFRTDKGLRIVDEQHAYYEFKYLRNQQLADIARHPDMFLKMLKAEEEGLVEVKVRLQEYADFKKQLFSDLASDNFSDIAEAWNAQRREVLDMALAKLAVTMAKGVKENLKVRCEDEIASLCREEFTNRLDQAPYKPAGMPPGTVPRVLALSCGTGKPGRDSISWVWVEEDGRVLEHGAFTDLHGDEKDINAFVELVQRRRPDVIGVSGFTVETGRLVADIEKIVEEADLRSAEFEESDASEEHSKRLDVILVNDEVARLYKGSDRALTTLPHLPELTRYCVALAKYLQNPMKEYAALGKDLISISLHPSQQLIPQEKIMKQLESAMVDMVNLCGVEINDAFGDPYTAQLLPYICGLGPRKATSVMKAIGANGGNVSSRTELVGDPDAGKLQVVGPRVWNNCASFLYIEYDASEKSSDYLDNTRVHPEDYELGRKMAADALELDEEDVKAEIDEAGPGAVVRRLIRDDDQEKVNDLILEEYAEQLERNFNQRKRATLETIRAELQQPYEELRRPFALLHPDRIFTMLTGETRDTLRPGMIVPVSVKRVLNHQRQLEVVLDCGIVGNIYEPELADYRDGINLNQIFSARQIIQAKIMQLSRSGFEATLSLRAEALQQRYRKQLDRMPGEWDSAQEEKDRQRLQENTRQSGRVMRVIRHPLFRSFNAAQAEEFLGSQSRGDAVIRPSSLGPDHITVTWKVADNIYQHIDVLELDKETEFSVGRTLKIGQKYSYSDLDELIVNHVKAMARKVDEMTTHEKFQTGTQAETERWLTTYTEANPKRSVYAFCINPKLPGYFILCFKPSKRDPLGSWPVKVVPNAFELQKNAYPDMTALCNGFKLLYMNMINHRRAK